MTAKSPGAPDAASNPSAPLSSCAAFRRLSRALPAGGLLCDEPLARHTTFRIGGPARYYLRPRTAAEVAAVMRIIQEEGLRFFTIGNGSDLLFGDEGFDGAIIEIGPMMSSVFREGNRLTVGAGIHLRDLAEASAHQGLSGTEFACGIPGTLGGALFMNAGAYGGQMSDIVESIRIVTEGATEEVLAVSPADFGYRHSPLALSRAVAVEAVLALTPASEDAIRARIADLTEQRNAKQPLGFPSAGSTFKRPAGHYASALIDQAGLKGFSIGDAAVSELHAGFVVNKGTATAHDVLAVIRHVQEAVHEKFGVSLETEIHIVT